MAGSNFLAVSSVRTRKHGLRRGPIRELSGQQRGDELLKVMISEALVQVLVAALGQRMRLLRENTMVSHRSTACPATRCKRGRLHLAEDSTQRYVEALIRRC